MPVQKAQHITDIAKRRQYHGQTRGRNRYMVTGAATVSLQVFCFVRLDANASTCGGYTINEGTEDPSRAWFNVYLD